MMWGYRSPRVVVADMVPGQVLVMGYHPEHGHLHWLGVGPASPHLMLVEVTVESNALQPGTAITMPLTAAGSPVWTVGRSEMHTLRLLHEGRGYKTEVRGDTRADVVAAHHPRCFECGELWPCRDERLDSEARRFLAEVDSQCAHCGQPIGGAWSESFFDGVTTRRYHVAKKYGACRRALAASRASLPGVDDYPPPPRGDAIGDGSREG
ncbi:MAG: hypothetical protein ACRDYV_09575 [Acidimicrobiia bacterium]